VTASVRWLGGATMEMRLGSFRLLTDPAFAEGPVAFHMDAHPSTGEDFAPIFRHAPLPPLELDGLDALLLSHIHVDHFDAMARARVPRTLWGLAPAEHVPQLERWGFDLIEGTITGEEHRLERGGEILRLQVLPARHSHDAATSAALGAVNGYLIEHETVRRTLRIAWTGDTVWFDELPAAVTRRGLVDVLVPHVGAVGSGGPWGLMSMDAEEAARLVEAVGPRLVVPVHHHTFSHYVEPVEVLVARMANRPLHDVLRFVEEGDVVRLD
jgi:N-acyl-phosphatidylethanolamine-hydrolysing phospholipase D